MLFLYTKQLKKIRSIKGEKKTDILDLDKEVSMINKKGDLVNTIKSESFSKLKDFTVDEKTKTIYVLNDSSLLKLALP